SSRSAAASGSLAAGAYRPARGASPGDGDGTGLEARELRELRELQQTPGHRTVFVVAPTADGSPRGLHLGWIPNDPGPRPREFPGRPPEAPKPDLAKLRAVSEARHWSGMRRVLVFSGVFALALFGGLGAVSHKDLFFAVAGGLGVVFWSAALASALAHRRALSALHLDEATRAERHVADLARHTQAVAAWQEAEAERVASAPRWLRVFAREEARRLDVFGG